LRTFFPLLFILAGYITSIKSRNSNHKNASLRRRHLTHRRRERDQADEHGWMDWFEGLASINLLVGLSTIAQTV
jgi:hypothetical protein